ncbi:uncharacterized protein PFLUO_LOCUS5132 [Penicillium psychrofluorescens]|uniref:uncharacterized protein n=1 Tax=Penicillium psychrofluorescens TaxID=3158075 RepID=UPI003CCDCB93
MAFFPFSLPENTTLANLAMKISLPSVVPGWADMFLLPLWLFCLLCAMLLPVGGYQLGVLWGQWAIHRKYARPITTDAATTTTTTTDAITTADAATNTDSVPPAAHKTAKEQSGGSSPEAFSQRDDPPPAQIDSSASGSSSLGSAFHAHDDEENARHKRNIGGLAALFEEGNDSEE